MARWRRAADAVRWGSFTSRNSEETTERGFANLVLAGIKKKTYWPKEGLALEIPFYIFLEDLFYVFLMPMPWLWISANTCIIGTRHEQELNQHTLRMLCACDERHLGEE